MRSKELDAMKSGSRQAETTVKLNIVEEFFRKMERTAKLLTAEEKQVKVQIASNAEVVAPSLPVSLAAGLFLGGLMGLGFAGFKDMAEKTFRSSDAVGDVLNTRVVGHVSFFDKSRNKKRNAKFPNVQPEVITLHAPAAQASESYRAIRTSIFFKSRETNAKIIQVTSPAPGDGKSTTTANLACTIAQAGSRVLLLDADMRKPTQHKLDHYW